MWSRGSWDSRCSADSESEKCSSASWMTHAPGTAGRWCFTESPARARPLSSTSRLSSETTSRSFAPLASRERRSCPTPRFNSSLCPIFELSARLARSAARGAFASRSASPPDTRRTRSWSASRCWVCCPRQRRISPSCVWSTMPSGSIVRRLGPSRSSPGGCWQRGSALLFATRERGEAFGGFPEVHVGPLGRRDARTLLESVLPARVDDRVLERIVAETHGNPLALLELPRGMTPSAARRWVRSARRRCRFPPGSRSTSCVG